ncbi:hypothetical protein SCHPADRAFT_833873, partial [Schizopora paradoxa]
KPCDKDGNILPEQTPPEGEPLDADDWSPFTSRVQFEVCELLYLKNEMSQALVDKLMELWSASFFQAGSEASAPFANHVEMHNLIDSIKHGDAPWYSFKIKYSGDIPEHGAPKWMTDTYEVCARDTNLVVANLLKNTDFDGEFDYVPYKEFDAAGNQRYCDYFSGGLVQKHADIIAQKVQGAKGAMYVPIILGSDKTTVSVATGQNDYHPVYLSIGNVTNAVRRAHRNAVTVVAFLAVPKSEKESDDSESFRRFRRQLSHISFAKILEPLKAGMTVPEVRLCPDKHYRRCIYGIGALIVDYPDQVSHTCIVQGWCPKCTSKNDNLDEPNVPRTYELAERLILALDPQELWDDFGMVSNLAPFTNDFPRADVYELISPDILHQIIKGTFKDHLVHWIKKYLDKVYGKVRAKKYMMIIDRRLAAVPPFSCLRRFAEGRGFKQWTGDDSKALMKVYLPAIRGIVPSNMVRAIRAFLDFCYLVRRAVITDTDIAQIQDAIERFHLYREVFRTTRVRPSGFSLPRQHSMVHYPRHIQLFAAPNGLCTSITESKHIKAVKKPWRRSNKFNAIKQMLLTNQRLDKLAAARVDFKARGMLQSSCIEQAYDEFIRNKRAEARRAVDPNVEADNEAAEGVVEGPQVFNEVKLASKPQRKYPKTLEELANHPNIQIPLLPLLVGRFLYRELNEDAPFEIEDDTILPRMLGRVFVFHSATSLFHSPSDLSGVGGMRKEIIRATPSWRKGPPRYDCVFITTDDTQAGFRGLHVARVKLFFAFVHREIRYDCALVHWYVLAEEEPDELTGMWMVKPDLYDDRRTPRISVIHVDAILRAAHLIPVYGNSIIDKNHKFETTLDTFSLFFVNKYADHHSNEIAF